MWFYDNHIWYIVMTKRRRKSEPTIIAKPPKLEKNSFKQLKSKKASHNPELALYHFNLWFWYSRGIAIREDGFTAYVYPSPKLAKTHLENAASHGCKTAIYLLRKYDINRKKSYSRPLVTFCYEPNKSSDENLLKLLKKWKKNNFTNSWRGGKIDVK